MACPINTEDIGKLKIFIEFVSTQPSILNLPQLGFFKKFVEQLGGKVPEANFQHNAGAKTEAKEEKEFETKMEDPEPESDIELELLDTIIEGDADPLQEMGEDEKMPTDDEVDQASEFRGKGAASYSDGEYEDAINFYTQAILLNPTHALFYAKRAQAFIKLCKPNAAIRDCDRALHLNPDNAAAYKFRGRANRLLGNWEAAAKDLRQACKLDYDDETDDWLKEVTPNAKKLNFITLSKNGKRQKWKMKLDANVSERLKKQIKKTAEENEKKQYSSSDDDFMSSLGPDVMEAFNDPEVAAALQDVMSNPANIMKYQNNPKVMNLLKKFAGATGGFPGGIPGMGGMGGFPTFPSAQTTTPNHPKSNSKPKEEYDDGLD